MDMNASATDVVHAVLYVLPGVVLLALVTALRAAGSRPAADAGAPRWARRYYRFSTAMLFLVGAGVLAIGGVFAVAVLRG
jgi:FAD/FMN-containing dehydrogenase